MPQKPQTTRSQTEHKHNNQFRSVRTEALRWLDFIIIDVLNIE